MYPHDYFPDEYYSELFFPEEIIPPEDGEPNYFPNRYFKNRYFPKRYFPKIPVPVEPNYFPNRYFKNRYFPKRYFPKILVPVESILGSCTINCTSTLTCSTKIIRYGRITINCQSSLTVIPNEEVVIEEPETIYEMGGAAGIAFSGFKENIKTISICMTYKNKKYSQTKSKNNSIKLNILKPAVLGKSRNNLKTEFSMN